MQLLTGCCLDAAGGVAQRLPMRVARFRVYIRWTPHPVVATIGDNRDCITVLLYSYYTTIAGWGGPPRV